MSSLLPKLVPPGMRSLRSAAHCYFPSRFAALAACACVSATLTASAQTSYYIANAGSDANDGKSMSTPIQTIAHFNSAIMPNLQNGDSVSLNRGDVFRDDYIRCSNIINITSPAMTLQTNPPKCSGITFDAYGSGANPLLDGADPLLLTWTLVAGSTTTYQATLTGATPSKLYVDSATVDAPQLLPVPNAAGVYNASTVYNQFDGVTATAGGADYYVRGALPPTAGAVVTDTTVWVDVYNSNSGNTSQTFSKTNSGLQNVEAIPGSWYITGSTMYVQLADGSNPNSHTFEGTQRKYGVLMQGVNNVTVQNIDIAHVQKSGVASLPYPASQGEYFTGDYIKVLDCHIYNYADLVTDKYSFQGHFNYLVGGVLIRENGDYAPHLIVDPLVGFNNIGTMDIYFANRGSGRQAGIYLTGVDAHGSSNDVIVKRNHVSTVNGQGIVYSVIDLYYNQGQPILNNGGAINTNELVNNQGNLFFGGTNGGQIRANKIHDSYGQGIQSGGGSTSTTGNPQTFSYNVLYHLSKGASGVGINGFDCNGNLTNGYWLNNTVYDAYGNSFTVEGGCTTPHVHNNIFDQNALAFPQFTTINGGDVFYAVNPSSQPNADFSNNLWMPGSNKSRAFTGSTTNYTCATFFTGWPDSNSQCAEPQFVNAAQDNFNIQSTSPAVGAGVGGVDIGACALNTQQGQCLPPSN